MYNRMKRREIRTFSAKYCICVIVRIPSLKCSVSVGSRSINSSLIFFIIHSESIASSLSVGGCPNSSWYSCSIRSDRIASPFFTGCRFHSPPADAPYVDSCPLFGSAASVPVLRSGESTSSSCVKYDDGKLSALELALGCASVD